MAPLPQDNGFQSLRPISLPKRVIKPSLLRRGWILTAWALLGFVVFATWGPQSLRPHLGGAQFERFGAYFVAAMAFVFAYPRRPLLIAVAAVIVALFLELGQLFIPGRDAGVADAIAKSLGGLAGAGLAAGTTYMIDFQEKRRQRSTAGRTG